MDTSATQTVLDDLPPANKLSFAGLLRRFRLESGLSYNQLSELTRVNGAYIYQLENQKRSRPGRNIVLRLAIGLHLDCDKTGWLLALADCQPIDPDWNTLRSNIDA
jgi:transcriptional regulator with XRE-family HTH domain